MFFPVWRLPWQMFPDNWNAIEMSISCLLENKTLKLQITIAVQDVWN